MNPFDIWRRATVFGSSIRGILLLCASLATQAQAQCPGDCHKIFAGSGGTSTCNDVVIIVEQPPHANGTCDPPPGSGPDDNCEFNFDVFVVVNPPCFLWFSIRICVVGTLGLPIPPCAESPPASGGTITQFFRGYPVTCGRQDAFYYKDPFNGALVGFVELTCTSCF